MASLFGDPEFRRVFDVPAGEEDRKNLSRELAQREDSDLPANHRLRRDPCAVWDQENRRSRSRCGWRLAVASTSAKPSVDAVLTHAVGESTANRFIVLAGDVVAAKKPAPDIYQLASKKLEVPPENCVAIEDSRNGLLSGNSAGMRVLVTTSWFTTGEDFSEARLVVSALGDPDGERSEVRANRTGILSENTFG